MNSSIVVWSSSIVFMQVGEPLLSPSLGFPSLESLLRSLPDACTLRYSAGQLVVMGVASSATAHVQDMVAKQNTARRGKKRGGVIGTVNRGRGGAFRGGRGGRGFGRSYWHGNPSYRPSLEGSHPRFQSPCGNTWRQDLEVSRPTWGSAYQCFIHQTICPIIAHSKVWTVGEK